MPVLTRIDFLRHGETQGGPRFRGSTDDPLVDVGLEQMKRATGINQRWDRVISSPLARCAEFAEIFARQNSLTLTFDERLKEMHFGAWEGRTAADLMADTPDALTRFWSNPDKYPPPGGEPVARFQARVLDAWSDIVTHHTGQCVLVVTHGGVIRVLLCWLLDRPVTRLQEFEIRHGGLYGVLVHDDGEALPASEANARA